MVKRKKSSKDARIKRLLAEIRLLKERQKLPPELEKLRNVSQAATDLRMSQYQRERIAKAQARVEQQLETTARRLREQLERGLVASGLATRVGDDIISPVPIAPTKRVKQERIAWRDIRTGRFAKTPENAVALYQKLKVLQEARDEQAADRDEAFRGQDAGETTLSEGQYTRVRASFVVTRGTRTECTANAFIKRPGLATVGESMTALAGAFSTAAQTGLQGNVSRTHPDWEGLATMGNGDCAGTIADILRQFAEAPDPSRIQKIVNSLFDIAGVSFNGEVTVSWRNIIRYVTRRGNERERLEVIPGRDARRFVFGVGIRPTGDEDLGKGLY